MKIRSVLVGVLIAASANAFAGLATDVSLYYYPCALPDVNVQEFGTARDNLLAGIEFFGRIDTHSRVNMPSGLELRDVFDASDIGVSTNSFWRGNFNPGGSYANQRGSRVYCPVLAVGNNGKLTLENMRYRVECGVGLLGYQSTLSSLPYSVSRIGIQKGSDNILGTLDDIFLISGPGTTEVDAIAFIGGRVGAEIDSPGVFAPLNTEIGSGGTYMTFIYQFVSGSTVVEGRKTLSLYQRGLIPNSKYGPMLLNGPRGTIISLVGPPGVNPMSIFSARRVTGPWNFETDHATEGSSYFFSVPSAQIADAGFLWTTNPPTLYTGGNALVQAGSGEYLSNPGSELAQDR